MRGVLLYADDVEAEDWLLHALSVAVEAAPVANAPGDFGQPQQRMSREETDALIVDLIRRAAPHIHVGSSGPVPKDPA